MIITLRDGILNDGSLAKETVFLSAFLLPASPSSGSSSNSSSSAFLACCHDDPDRDGLSRQRVSSASDTADARPARSPCGEGRSVWLTDTFRHRLGRNVLPGADAAVAVFAPPLGFRCFSHNTTDFTTFLYLARRLQSLRQPPAWESLRRLRQGRPREGWASPDEQGENADAERILVGLSRQVALAREMDVVANNIANLNTTGYKADGSVFEEYLSSPARADQTGTRVSFVQRPRHLARYEPGRGRAHRQSTRRRDRRPRLPGACRRRGRSLHPQRLDADQRDRPARHQRRLSGARRRRPDHAAGERQPTVDQPRRHDQRARRHLERRFRARQDSTGHLRQSAAIAEGRQRHVQSARRRAAATRGDATPVLFRGRSRNRTCTASSRCRA